jgi:tetratricopeptide (TPR) repeat protein
MLEQRHDCHIWRARTAWAGCIVVVLGASGTTAGAATQSAAWCESRWEQVSDRYLASKPPDSSELLRSWRELQAQCDGTGVYEVRLATIHAIQKEFGTAQKVLASVKSVAPEYAALLEATRLQVDFEQYLAKVPPPTDISEFGPRFAKLIADAPSSYLAYELNATYWLTSGEPRRAIDVAKRALEHEPKSWWSYRVMAIAYSELGDHGTATQMGDRAHKLHPAVSADADFMLALARSYVALGDRKMGETVLSLLFTYRPEVRQTQQYRDTLVFIREKLEQSRSQPSPR